LCKIFIFWAKPRETFFLGKAADEWLPLALYKNALRRDCGLFEVPVAEMVKCCAQEQTLPITVGNAPIFERFEGFLQFAAGLPTPKIAIKIRMLMRQLFVHHSGMGASWGSGFDLHRHGRKSRWTLRVWRAVTIGWEARRPRGLIPLWRSRTDHDLCARRRLEPALSKAREALRRPITERPARVAKSIGRQGSARR